MTVSARLPSRLDVSEDVKLVLVTVFLVCAWISAYQSSMARSDRGAPRMAGLHPKFQPDRESLSRA